jgi:hypothetical protein
VAMTPVAKLHGGEKSLGRGTLGVAGGGEGGGAHGQGCDGVDMGMAVVAGARFDWPAKVAANCDGGGRGHAAVME